MEKYAFIDEILVYKATIIDADHHDRLGIQRRCSYNQFSNKINHQQRKGREIQQHHKRHMRAENIKPQERETGRERVSNKQITVHISANQPKT